MTKRIEISIETTRITVVTKAKAVTGWCAECLKDVDWLTVDQAARITGGSWRNIFQLIESGEIHASESGDLVHMFVRDQDE